MGLFDKESITDALGKAKKMADKATQVAKTGMEQTKTIVSEKVEQSKQNKLNHPTANTLDIWETAVELFRRHHTSREPVRSLSVKASGLTPADGVVQLSLFPEEQKGTTSTPSSFKERQAWVPA